MANFTNGIFTLNWNDLLKGLIVAVFAATATYLLVVLNAPGFSFQTINWAELARIGFASGLGYMVKNLISDNKGSVLGVTPNTN